MTSRGAGSRRPGVDLPRLMAAWIAALAAQAAGAQFGGFTWTLAGNPDGSGSLTASGLHVVGPDSASCESGHTTQFETVMPAKVAA